MSDPSASIPPETSSDRDLRLARIVAEFADRQAHEEDVNLEEFCRAYPDLEAKLRPALESLSEFEPLCEPSTPTPEAEVIEDHLSGHRILGEIGSGGMGQVLLAVDERLNRKVAIKTLKPHFRKNSVIRTRFLQEARAMARLSHPNIVHIYNLGLPTELPHFVMEYLEGAPLTEVARPLPIRRKVELVHKVVLAVEDLHQHQIVHRDLKPGNILVGANLEPKLLDFGLALEVHDSAVKLTHPGEAIGTPNYFSPEQTLGERTLDARSDIFSLGTILYELLTGVIPFRGETLAELTRNIREQNPALPRRLDRSIPGELQNICLKALEKDPVQRYGSAQEMAADLERYLAGEPVLAMPTAYAQLTSARIEQHLHELEGWKQDHIVSEYEFDALRHDYNRLVEPEDAWILQVRRLTASQVTLYFGSWILVVGAALLFLFEYPHLFGTRAVLLVMAPTVLTAVAGIQLWKKGQLRISVAYLLAFCLLVPTTWLSAMTEYHWFSAFTQGRKDLDPLCGIEHFKGVTNAQMWWAIVLSLPAHLWIRRFTKSSVYSLVVAVMVAMLSWVSLLRMGMVDWINDEDQTGRIFLRLIPFALLFFAVAMILEYLRRENDSRYFYPVAVVFTYTALSGVAAYHKPLADWLLDTFPWTRGQVEYFFIVNAAIYYGLQKLCESLHTSQMRSVAKSFRFVLPGHVMVALLLLGIEASRLWNRSPQNFAMRREARIFEFLLPIVGTIFVFGSVPKQMKNFFISGMVFVAIGIDRLQQDYFQDRAVWPIFLLVMGALLMIVAANYSTLWALPLHWRRKS